MRPSEHELSEELLAGAAANTTADATATAGSQEGLAGFPAHSVDPYKTLDRQHSVTQLGPTALKGLVLGKQPVYTATGPRTAEELAASGKSFEGLVNDPALGRYAARKAWVIPAGEGEAYAVTADRDTFLVGPRTYFELAQRGRIPVGGAKGRRIVACTTYEHTGGYVRSNLRDGKKGKELLHRLVVQDVGGEDITGRVVHHEDGNKLNNTLENLVLLDDQSKHATIHATKLVEAGEHPFQLNTYPKAGKENGMHRDGDFWSSPKKAKRYRTMKRKEMLDRDPVALQKKSIRRQALDNGHRVRNAGYDFRTMEEYLDGHQKVIGRIGSKPKKRASILRQFGSIAGFITALNEENHRVLRVEPIGVQPLYSIVISSAGGDPVWTPPVVIWPVGSTSPFGSGIVIHT